MSRTGAYIVPDDPRALPELCEIWIPHLELKVAARVRWRKKGGAGLEFATPVEAARLG